MRKKTVKRNICTDEKEFFRAVLETLRDPEANSDYADDYKTFDDVDRDDWERIANENIYDIISVITYDNRFNVNVDTENVAAGGEYTNGEGFDGLNRTSKGELFFGFDCGGDWEVPLNAILYVEDGIVKAYVPEKGNLLCEREWCAYGSEENADELYEDGVEEAHENDHLDASKMMKDIEDFFHHRPDGMHSDGTTFPTIVARKPNGSVPEEMWSTDDDDEAEKADGQSAIPGLDMDGLKDLIEKLNGMKSKLEETKCSCGKCNDNSENGDNVFYFVNTSVWCVREGRNGVASTVAANSGTAYPNAFNTYEEAVDYVHLIMMINHHCQIHDWDKFSQTISIVEDGGDVPTGEGYVHHAMEHGVERFEGFDTNGNFPCLIDDITITMRKVHAVRNISTAGSPEVLREPMKLEAVKVQHFIKDERASEFTDGQHDDNQKAVDRIASEMGGLDEMFDKDQQKEFDKMKKLLGWDDDEEEKK